MPRIRDSWMKRFAQPEELPDTSVSELRKPTKGGSGIIIDGADNLEVKIARCCSPLQGEPIVGFSTIAHGITVHSQNCKKYKEALSKADPDELSRWLPAQWASDAPPAEMKVSIEVLCVNRMGLLGDITTVINEAHLPVSNFNFHMLKSGNAMLDATVSVSSREQLDTLLSDTLRCPICAKRKSV